MHPSAQRYFSMHVEDQEKVQIRLCQHALEVWESLVPADLTYRESVLGSKQIFDAKLPRMAFNSVLSGLDNQTLMLCIENRWSRCKMTIYASPKKLSSPTIRYVISLLQKYCVGLSILGSS